MPGEQDKTTAQADRGRRRRDERLRALNLVASRLRKVSYSQKQDKEWDKILRMKDLHIFVFSLMGLVASIFLSYYTWAQELTDEHGTRVDANLANADATTLGVMYTAQFVISFSTLVTIILIGQTYALKLMQKRREWSGMEMLDLVRAENDPAGSEAFRNSYSFWRSDLRYGFLAEVLVHIVHPIITLNQPENKQWQTLYEITQTIIFFRLYLVFRVSYVFSDAYKFRHDIVASNKELQRIDYRLSSISTAKILFYNHPGPMVLVLTVLSLLIFGFWIFVVERNNQPQSFGSVGNCFWYAWVTFSTIGYGDFFPLSLTGRLVAMAIGTSGLIITTLFGGVVTNLLVPSREQKYVTEYLAIKDGSNQFKHAAAQLIWKAFCEVRTARRLGFKPRPSELYSAVKDFRSARLAMRQSIGTAADPVIDMKIARTIGLAKLMLKNLDTQAKHIEKLERKLLRTTAAIKKQAKRQ